MLKRILDLVLVAVCFLPSLILVMFFSLLLKVCLGKGSSFYTQTRIGQNETPFKIYKLKTLLNPTAEKITDAQRSFPLGTLIRSLSIDELPQLWNILKGDMSFIGPRPLLPEYLPLYNEEQKRRHQVRPGITGLAQVEGRNSLSWQEKFKLDVEYVDNLSFLLDLKILFKTFLVVIKRVGINQKGEATAAPFRGNTE